ncbi:HRDC domain-containing protein [Candidatus Eisenbacteria bacterium]|uniref:HRDC domain-containing protein n=1 Tax=Eiseniibacteriota bacterium TaxID=2212470 RepID=A0ABV6YK12_UNCEI
MPYKTFLIPIRDAASAERELNGFMRCHRVLAVDRQWIDQGLNSLWVVSVDYLESSATESGDTNSGSKRRVDYKEVLSPEDFEVFAGLRGLRKEIAAEDGVALYNVFTNEQLAQIVQGKVRTPEDLRQIAGIGEARAEKYGPRVLDFLSTVWDDSNEEGGEAAGTGD